MLVRAIIGFSLFGATQVLGQTPVLTTVQWREDLAMLAAELPQRHPDAFTRITPHQWDSATAALESRLPRMNRNEILVELHRLVALIGDAHTSLNPAFDPALGMRYYPMELYVFEDGLFVKRAAQRFDAWVGAKVLAIGNAGSREALAAVAPTISHENDWWVRHWAPMRLMIPEFLDGLGLVEDGERAPIVLERGGTVDTLVLEPAGLLGGHGHEMTPVDTDGWADMRVSEDLPLWLKNSGQPFWFEYLPESKTLYVSYKAVSPAREFWDEVFSVADRELVDRFVLDIRDNMGGNRFFNRRVIREIVRRPEIDKPDVLFVIVGRKVFSAAMNLANDLDWWTNATFVGEPTGQSTNAFGDHEALILPNSGVTVNISTLFHQAPNVLNRRLFLAPDAYTPLTSHAYQNGIDPAMEAILASPLESVTALIDEAVRMGDTDQAEAVLREARHAVVNRYRNIEAEVNSLGYSLLRGSEYSETIAVFQLNARVFPHSANAFDSLGEALAAVGRRDEAIAAYRRALQISPGFASSVHGLRRLEER